MTSRILEPSEYHRLVDVRLPDIGPAVADGDVLAVMEGPAIIGTWAALVVVHAEAAWVHADHRGKAAVGRHLWKAMREYAKARGVTAVVSAMPDPRIAQMAQARGARPIAGPSMLVRMV